MFILLAIEYSIFNKQLFSSLLAVQYKVRDSSRRGKVCCYLSISVRRRPLNKHLKASNQYKM